MLATRNTQVQAKESSQGGPSVWVNTYQKVRCLESCPLGPHCWCDPRDKKRYKLSTHHLRRLVKFVQDGGRFHSHADLPEFIQEDLYAEAEATRSRKRKARAMSPPAMTPITINNHFPETSGSQSLVNPTNEAGKWSTKDMAGGVKSPLVVSGYLDTAVRKYTTWQQSRFEDVELKDEMSKACDIVLGHGLTLTHIHDDQDFQFLIDNGIKQGIARHFVGHIKMWTKRSQVD